MQAKETRPTLFIFQYRCEIDDKHNRRLAGCCNRVLKISPREAKLLRGSLNSVKERGSPRSFYALNWPWSQLVPALRARLLRVQRRSYRLHQPARPSVCRQLQICSRCSSLFCRAGPASAIPSPCYRPRCPLKLRAASVHRYARFSSHAFKSGSMREQKPQLGRQKRTNVRLPRKSESLIFLPARSGQAESLARALQS